MSVKSLKDLAANFAAKTAPAENTGNQTWKLFFPFWKAETNTTSVVRFLPDQDDKNPLGFLVENLTHTLIVNGRRETVACASMYGEDCPIYKQSRQYYAEAKEAGETRERPGPLTALGKKYYRKLNYIGQIIVNDTPIEHDAEQLVKLVEFGPKIFKQMQAAFASGDLDNFPYKFKGGYNFRFNKTQSGQYADYGTSSFAPRQTDVSDELIEQIELFDLATKRAEYVSAEQLEAMLAADLAGGEVETPKAKPAAKPKMQLGGSVDTDEADDADEAPKAPAKLSVAEQLRARQAARAAEAAAAGE